RLHRNFGLTPRIPATTDRETVRHVPVSPPPAQTAQTDVLLPGQPRGGAGGGIHAPFLRLGAMTSNSPKPGRERQRSKCACPERGPSEGDRIHQNVICLKCRGSVPIRRVS